MEVFAEKRRLVIFSSPIFCSSTCRLGGTLTAVCACAHAGIASATHTARAAQARLFLRRAMRLLLHEMNAVGVCLRGSRGRLQD